MTDDSLPRERPADGGAFTNVAGAAGHDAAERDAGGVRGVADGAGGSRRAARSAAFARSSQRTREVAEHLMPVQSGIVVREDGLPAVEESPYERLFTGGNTVMPKPAPLRVDTARVILAGIALWVVGLVVVLVVPALHGGERHWWPWTCVAGIVLGFLGWAYVRRGRGNAEAA